MSLTLYDYFRSSSSYRVRIALELKALDYDIIHIDLLKGQQKGTNYTDKNPQGFVPMLEDGGIKIAQSLAILEYLEEVYPQAPLLPDAPQERALCRQLSLLIACEISPLNNPKVWKGYVGKELGVDEAGLNDWYHHWIHEGFKAYEKILASQSKQSQFSLGDVPSIADLCLIPQMYNARRFGVNLETYPVLCHIEQNCMALDAFQKAAPESQKAAPQDLEIIHGPNAPILNKAA